MVLNWASAKRILLGIGTLAIGFVILASFCLIATVIAFAVIMAPGGGTDLVQQCQVPETSAVVSLETTHGGLATSSIGFFVSLEEPPAGRRIVFQATSSPSVDAIQCEKDAVVLLAKGQEPLVLPLDWIGSDLVHKPLSFSHGTLESLEYEDRVKGW